MELKNIFTPQDFKKYLDEHSAQVQEKDNPDLDKNEQLLKLLMEIGGRETAADIAIAALGSTAALKSHGEFCHFLSNAMFAVLLGTKMLEQMSTGNKA